MVEPPRSGDDWVALTEAALPSGEAIEWAGLPSCGAVVYFSGIVRDHADGRPDVSEITYEAYTEHVEPRLRAVAAHARKRWPDVGRLALLHRVGRLVVGECSVVVVASAPHRPEAFAAAQFGIDTLKATVPIWKLEKWDGGEAWGLCAHDIEPVA